MNDLVSIVIPAYNRENTIERAVRSVLYQTYKNIEVIVVDDCSKDNTKSIVLNNFGNDNRVIYHCLEKNSGACVARNKGVELSNGKYIAFLDSDDEFVPNKIEIQVAKIRSTGAQMCATDYTIYHKDGSKGIVKTYNGTREEIYNELLYCNFITTGTLMGLRVCFLETPFDESQPRYQDWDIVLRLCQKYSFSFINESTLLQYYQPISITASTNHSKTLYALNVIYERNKEGYIANKRAYSQIHWLMGIHGMLTNNKSNFRDMWIGATANGINIKRLLIVVATRIGLLKIISKNI